jgi:hypothetical protein
MGDHRGPRSLQLVDVLTGRRLKTVARVGVDASLGKFGLMRSKLTQYGDYRNYIPFTETLDEARDRDMTVGDYIDWKHNTPGVTQKTVDKMASLGVFEPPPERICEIGPGSGHLLEKVLQYAPGARCEVYETAEEWRDWLVATYGVVGHSADGRTLRDTPSGSVDLVQAHKVFPGLPTLACCTYMEEMARALSPGGHAVFDLFTEECLDREALRTWIDEDVAYQCYPSLMPRQFAIDLMTGRGLDLVGAFPVAMRPGWSECLVFRKPHRSSTTGG